MKLKPLLLLAALVLLPVLTCGQQVVTVTGAAAILKGDTAQARDRALENALRAAVEQVMGTMVDSESLVKNNELISDKIYTQTAGYITSYKVLSEKGDSDINLYKVTVEASVNQGNLENDLGSMGILMRRMKMPRVAVAIREDVSEAASMTLLRLFKDKGFLMVDTGGREPWRQSTFWVIKENEQVDLFNKYGAEVVVLGTAEATAGGYVPQSSMRSYQGNVSIKAIRSDTHEVLGSASGSGKAVEIGDNGIAQALRQASTIAGNDLSKQIMSQWAQESSSARRITLDLTGVSAGEADSIAKKLREMGRGVQDVVVRQSGDGGASLDISMQGDSEALAQELLKLFPKFKIKARTANKLTAGR